MTFTFLPGIKSFRMTRVEFSEKIWVKSSALETKVTAGQLLGLRRDGKDEVKLFEKFLAKC